MGIAPTSVSVRHCFVADWCWERPLVCWFWTDEAVDEQQECPALGTLSVVGQGTLEDIASVVAWARELGTLVHVGSVDRRETDRIPPSQHRRSLG